MLTESDSPSCPLSMSPLVRSLNRMELRLYWHDMRRSSTIFKVCWQLANPLYPFAFGIIR